MNEGRNVRFTPNGLSVISRQRAISFASSSGVFWVRPVMMPSPPAFETAAASSAKADKVHAALNDRMLDAEQFCNPCFHARTSLRDRASFMASPGSTDYRTASNELSARYHFSPNGRISCSNTQAVRGCW